MMLTFEADVGLAILGIAISVLFMLLYKEKKL